MRAKHPEVSIAIGNDMPGLQEEFLRHKFPSKLFDTLGNESPSYCLLPESQPPNCLANNSSLWIQRQLLDAYGYKDKPVSQCHEVCYPSTNPGNSRLQDPVGLFCARMPSIRWPGESRPSVRASSPMYSAAIAGVTGALGIFPHASGNEPEAGGSCRLRR